PVTLSDPNSSQPTFTAPDAGLDGASLTFQLTVVDAGGLQSTDTCIVNVAGVNLPPTADAGPDQTVEEGAVVTLNGSNSSDPDDGIASYLWEQTAGTPVTLSDPNSSQPTFTAPDAGLDGASLTFQLTVTDGGGLQATDTCTVNIAGANNPPTADAGPDQEVEEGVVVTLDGSNSSDPDNWVASYLWEQTSGPQVTLSDPNSAQPTFTAPDVGPDGISLTFKLTVTDMGGLQATDTCIVNVSWVNIPPTADAGPDQTVGEGTTVMLDGSNSSDPDDGIASYLWEQTAGTPVVLSDPNASQPTFTAPDAGLDGVALVFQLTVTDGGGLKATGTCIVNVSNVEVPPVADAGPDQTVVEATTVALDGSNSSDSDGGVASYLWTQIAGKPGKKPNEKTGNGRKKIGIPVTLSDPMANTPTFVAPAVGPGGGVLTFRLTVTDHAGLKGSDLVSVIVGDNGIKNFPENVITIKSPTDKDMGIEEEGGGNITKLNVVAPSSVPDGDGRPEDLIYGLVDMEIKVYAPGDEARVSFYLSTPAPDGYGWYKYSPNDGWRDFSANAAFNSARDKVTLTVVDGGAGDDDGVANGVIVDPSGLGSVSTSSGGGETTAIRSSSGSSGCFIGEVRSSFRLAR
nr:hypothetical protein [Pseudomonadota bacterium]